MAERTAEKKQFKLSSVEGINDAVEFIFNKQVAGELDGKTVDSLNTTLKASMYLNVKLRMDYQKMWLQARIKKIDLPKGFIPELDNLAAQAIK